MIVMRYISCRQWHNITKLFWVTIEKYLSYLLPKFEDLVPTSLGSGAIWITVLSTLTLNLKLCQRPKVTMVNSRVNAVKSHNSTK